MKKTYVIATIGSHSALQILKGANDEGFKTLLFVKKESYSFYKRFSFITTLVSVASYQGISSYKHPNKNEQIIMIPHGSFVSNAYETGNKQLSLSYFGNKHVLEWEGDRNQQLVWFKKAGLRVPQLFTVKDTIDKPVIVKSFGAAGGKGYFLATSKKDLLTKMKSYKEKNFIIQEYIIGVPMYFHFFYSPITKIVELLSIDRRYETNVDTIGRIPMAYQQTLSIDPSFVVVGNSPLSVRESLLPEVYDMAERILASSRELIDERGLFGPFCLETIITPDQKVYVMEISCRIVAGTNLFIDGSPYAALYYDEPMSTGRRIAREIKVGIKENKIQSLLD